MFQNLIGKCGSFSMIRLTYSPAARVWILASFIMSTNAWASFPERRSETRDSSRSEKMDLIRPTRSRVGRVGLINRFHAGGLLDLRMQSSLRTDYHPLMYENVQVNEISQNFRNFWALGSVFVPTLLDQSPQPTSDIWMSRSCWTPATLYG